MTSVAKNACIAEQVEFDLAEEMPVKNTFVHFGGASRRSLRACKSEPADPHFPQTTRPCASDECLHAEAMSDVTDNAPDVATFSIQTPELTPRRLESPPPGDVPLGNRTAVHFQLALPDELLIKNTFFCERTSSRSLRICKSEPADPVLPPSKWGHLDMNSAAQEEEINATYFDTENMTDTTDDRSSLDLELDLLDIQTPELTPRHFDSPVDSLAASLASTPTTWHPQPQVEPQEQKSPLQGAAKLTLASLTGSNVMSEPAFASPLPPPTLSSCTYPTINITLRLAEKGKLGVYFGNSLGNETLVVEGILPGQALHAWNRQCMFGNNDNTTRYVALGDVLVSVNGKTCWPDMLQECAENMLLKMVFVRYDPWASFGGYRQDQHQ